MKPPLLVLALAAAFTIVSCDRFRAPVPPLPPAPFDSPPAADKPAIDNPPARPPERIEIARVPCGDRKRMIAALKTQLGQSRVAIALTSAGYPVEHFVAANGAWTILLTVPRRPTCVLISGVNYFATKRAKGKPV